MSNVPFSIPPVGYPGTYWLERVSIQTLCILQEKYHKEHLPEIKTQQDIILRNSLPLESEDELERRKRIAKSRINSLMEITAEIRAIIWKMGL